MKLKVGRHIPWGCLQDFSFKTDVIFASGQEECETETGSLYCPVCGRVWTNALTPTNPAEGASRRIPASTIIISPRVTQAPPPPVHEAVLSTWTAPPAVDSASFILLQNQIIPGLKSCLSVWKSVFSEEVNGFAISATYFTTDVWRSQNVFCGACFTISFRFYAGYIIIITIKLSANLRPESKKNNLSLSITLLVNVS